MNCTNPDILYFFLVLFIAAMCIPMYFFIQIGIDK
jgi:hypothetical protein